MIGRHKTKKKPEDSTYNSTWSGVSYAPKCNFCLCDVCNGHLHKEGKDSHYCPYCDDFRPPTSDKCEHR